MFKAEYGVTFVIIWAVVLVLNQVLFFHATFAPYAIKAALPHTCIISIIITCVYVINDMKKEKEKENK